MSSARVSRPIFAALAANEAFFILPGTRPVVSFAAPVTSLDFGKSGGAPNGRLEVGELYASQRVLLLMNRVDSGEEGLDLSVSLSLLMALSLLLERKLEMCAVNDDLFSRPPEVSKAFACNVACGVDGLVLGVEECDASCVSLVGESIGL